MGKSDVFIRHDWLRKHNPTIDWEKATVNFDRCPSNCGYTAENTRIDDDPNNDMDFVGKIDLELEDGDHISAFDWEGYIRSEKIRKTPMMPDYTKMFAEVFSATKFDQLPER